MLAEESFDFIHEYYIGFYQQYAQLKIQIAYAYSHIRATNDAVSVSNRVPTADWCRLCIAAWLRRAWTCVVKPGGIAKLAPPSNQSPHNWKTCASHRCILYHRGRFLSQYQCHHADAMPCICCYGQHAIARSSHPVHHAHQQHTTIDSPLCLNRPDHFNRFNGRFLYETECLNVDSTSFAVPGTILCSKKNKNDIKVLQMVRCCMFDSFVLLVVPWYSVDSVLLRVAELLLLWIFIQ